MPGLNTQPMPDDEIPQYHPFLMGAAGMAPQAPPAVGVTAPPQVTVTPPAQPAPTQAIPVQPMQVPQAPVMDQNQFQLLNKQVQQYNTPTNPKDPAVKPKWWERLAGAAVGAGVGYNEGASAGMRAGAAVTNRRYDEAEATRQGNEQAAQQNLQSFKDEYDTRYKGYEGQLKQFDAERGAQRDADEQNNRNRNFDRETANDKATQQHQKDELDRQTDRDAEQARQFNVTSGREQARDNEQARHNKQEEGIGWTNANKEPKGKGGPGDVKPMTANQRQELTSKHDYEYREAGNAKARELAAARTPEEKAAVEQKYTGIANKLQDEWNQRYSESDPDGRYSQGAQQAAPPQQQATATPPPAPVAAPLPPPKQQSQAAPAPVQQGQQGALPPQAAKMLKPGVHTTFHNHTVWTLENGQPKRIK